jgi:hypothetical protein
VSPKTALAAGLKVDAAALPTSLKQQLKDGKVDLDDPATTLALLKLNSVVGVTGLFDSKGSLTSMGLQCALCHSTVDDSFAPGIGQRLDGWANRDLNVGLIISLAPNLNPFADLLGVDVATVKKVLTSWGPGRFDAILDKDGKALSARRETSGDAPSSGLRPRRREPEHVDGLRIRHVLERVRRGDRDARCGDVFDARFDKREQYPVAAKSRSGNTRSTPDVVTSTLAALHFYQLALPAPTPPVGSFDKDAAARRRLVFNGVAKCASCHVPPLFTEPGTNLHAPGKIGIDSFQADRSPTRMYRTAPLAGLWTHQKGGFYHDGRFATLRDVIDHYDRFFKLGLTEPQKLELGDYLKSL